MIPFMEQKPVSILLPAHAHLALRMYCLQAGTTMQRVVVEALNDKYPSLRALEPALRFGTPTPAIQVDPKRTIR